MFLGPLIHLGFGERFQRDRNPTGRLFWILGVRVRRGRRRPARPGGRRAAFHRVGQQRGQIRDGQSLHLLSGTGGESRALFLNAVIWTAPQFVAITHSR